jgi:hypothetical protein
LRPYPRWLGIAILLVIATVFALNHAAARDAYGDRFVTLYYG